MLRPAIDLRRGRAVREQLDRATVRVGEPDRALPLLVGHAKLLEMRPGVGGRAGRMQLEGRVVVSRLVSGLELEAVRLVVAGEDPRPLAHRSSRHGIATTKLLP